MYGFVLYLEKNCVIQGQNGVDGQSFLSEAFSPQQQEIEDLRSQIVQLNEKYETQLRKYSERKLRTKNKLHQARYGRPFVTCLPGHFILPSWCLFFMVMTYCNYFSYLNPKCILHSPVSINSYIFSAINFANCSDFMLTRTWNDNFLLISLVNIIISLVNICCT